MTKGHSVSFLFSKQILYGTINEGDRMTKLLVSDFDHTFFEKDDYEINIERVNKFVDNGNIFVIATGRNLNQIKEGIGHHQIKYSYIIANDGGIIFDSEYNILYRKDIYSSIVSPICELLRNSPIIKDYYIDAAYHLSRNEEEETNAIVAHFDRKDTMEAYQLLNLITYSFPPVHGYINEDWLSITDQDVSKGNGISILNEILNIDQHDIYTIGDTINDISMSIYHSYAMENGTDDLKKVCGKTVQSVYELIEKIEKKEI